MGPQGRKEMLKERVIALKNIKAARTAKGHTIALEAVKKSAEITIRETKTNPAPLTEEQKIWFRKKLESQLTELISEAKNFSKEFREELIAETSNSRYRASNHIADTTASNNRATELCASKYKKLIEKTKETLKRFNDGSYGICIDCGSNINIKRLEATPIADLCCGCKTEKERKEKKKKGIDGHRSFYPSTSRNYASY